MKIIQSCCKRILLTMALAMAVSSHMSAYVQYLPTEKLYYITPPGSSAYTFAVVVDHEEMTAWIHSVSASAVVNGVLTIPDEVTEALTPDFEAVYYNLSGLRVASPEPGKLYLKVAGGKTSKVIYR